MWAFTVSQPPHCEAAVDTNDRQTTKAVLLSPERFEKKIPPDDERRTQMKYVSKCRGVVESTDDAKG